VSNPSLWKVPRQRLLVDDPWARGQIASYYPKSKKGTRFVGALRHHRLANVTTSVTLRLDVDRLIAFLHILA